MAAEESKSKWEGKTSAEVANAEADQVWPLLEDFCNIHKWFPMDKCYQEDGVAGQPGLIRYCEATKKGEGEKKTIMWAKEKLLELDPMQRSVTYEVVESNMGFKSYVATMKVLPTTVKDAGPAGCKIQWCFVCDPVEGWTFEALFSYIESCLQSMANNMELAFSTT